MEECVNDKFYDDNEENDEEKEENETTYSESPTSGKGRGMSNERGGNDVSLFEEAEISSRPISESLNEKYDLVGDGGDMGK